MSDKTGCPILLAIFLALLTTPAFSLEAVAVNQLTASGVTKEEAASLTDAFRSELSKSGKYQVMERGQMEQILKEQGFQQSGACDEATCAIEMGKILAVNQIVMGTIGKVGRTYTLSVRVVEVGTGKIVKDITEYQKGNADELLTRTIPVVAAKLAGTYKAPSKTPVYIAIAGVAVVAIAVPVAYFASRKKPAETTVDAGSSLRVGW
jgi:hypothetical protein